MSDRLGRFCCGDDHYFDGPDDAEFATDDVIRVGIQDIKDGLALRRLREALPEDADLGVTMPSDGGVLVRADWPAPDRDGPRWFNEDGKPMDARFGDGATIAEAADRCREALG
jgi:hypothetical protein